MAPCFEESGRIERLTVPGALGFQPSCATSRNHSPKRTAVSIRAPEGARAFKAQCRAACSLSAGRRGVEPRCVDLESALLAEGQPSDRWTARGSNPPRVACKASLHPSAQPWRRTSRGRLSPGAHVPASSERQDSNLHGLGSRPSSHPLTHALSSLGSRRGSNPHLPVHSGMCRTTTSTATTSSGEGTRTPAKLIQSQLGAPGAPPIIVPRPRLERGSAGSKPAVRSTGPPGIAVRPSRIGLASTGYQPIRQSCPSSESDRVLAVFSGAP